MKQRRKMANVVVRSTCMVGPEKVEEEWSKVKNHLTPWDLILLKSEYAQGGLVFPKPNPGVDFISLLKASLSLALRIYYPLAGRLVKVQNDDDTASFHIDCDGSRGARFVHAVAETVSVSDVLEPVDGLVPEFIKSFFPANGIQNHQGVSEPLLMVQVTELKDGVFFGKSMNHLVLDGSSSLQFNNTWSKLSSSHLSNDFPSLRLSGWFLDGIDYPIRVPLSEIQTISGPKDSRIFPEKVFHFSKENISKLKAKANKEVGSGTDREISSLQAVIGHMWWSIIKHEGLNREQEVSCRLPVDMRHRLKTPLEKERFGNVIRMETVKTTAGEMSEHGPSWAALQIHEMVGSQTHERFKILAETWVKDVKIPGYGGVSGMVCTCLSVSGIPWYDEYDNEYGLGKPMAVRVGPSDNGIGRAVLFMGTEKGSLDVQTCLSSDLFLKLSADPEFLGNATVLCNYGESHYPIKKPLSPKL